MTNVGAVPTGGASGAQSNASAGGQTGLASLGNPQTFLKLLVAQLEYQDPLNPVNGSQFLSQVSELSQVQAVEQMQAEVQTESQDAGLQSAASILGMDVTAKVNGQTVSGVASSLSTTAPPGSSSGSGGPWLDIGGTLVPLSDVTEVSQGTSGTAGGVSSGT